jgi:hypothetical protein
VNFGPRYKRALTAIQVISKDSGAGKMVSNLIAVSNEIENEGNRRGSVHVGVDDENSVTWIWT